MISVLPALVTPTPGSFLYMLAKAVAPLALFLVVPFNQSLILKDLPSAVFRENFLGNVQDGQTTYSVMKMSGGDVSPLRVGQYVFKSSHTDPQQLVWIHERVVEPVVKLHARRGVQGSILDHFLDSLTTGWSNTDFPKSHEQIILVDSPGERGSKTSFPSKFGYYLHYRTETSALLSVGLEVAQTIENFLPAHWKYALLPSSPVPYMPPTKPSTEHVEAVLSRLKFDVVVASVANNISIAQMKNDGEYLTGEDGKSGLVSRNSKSDGAVAAAHWLKERFEETGLTCRLHKYILPMSFGEKITRFVF